MTDVEQKIVEDCNQGENDNDDTAPSLHIIKPRVPNSFLADSHTSFILRHFACHPTAYNSLDTNRITLLFFNLGSLELLNKIDLISDQDRQRIVKWIYSLQITTAEDSVRTVPPPKTPAPIVPDEDEDEVMDTVEDEPGPSISHFLPLTTPHLPPDIRPVQPRRPNLLLDPTPARQTVSVTTTTRKDRQSKSTGTSSAFSLPYYESAPFDFGVHSVLTPSVHGGLHFASYEEGAPLIAQYNLAAYWRRPQLGGVVGRLRPLLEPRMQKKPSNRIPGEFVFDTPAEELRGRCLLAANMLTGEEEEPGVVEVWCVNERSKRKKLEMITATVTAAGCLERATVAKRIDLPGAAQELRSTKSGVVWVCDTQRRLSLVRRDADAVVVCGEGVLSWSESVWMDGEVAIAVDGGRVCAGRIDRLVDIDTKSLLVQHVAHTDQPRMLLIGGGQHTTRIDLRASVERPRPGLPHFTVAPLNEVDSINNHLPYICHLETMRASPRHTVVVTDIGLHVVDERLPDRALLSTCHPFACGGDGVRYAGARSADDGSRVHTLCMWSQRRAQWMEWQVYEHACGLISSVGPWSSIGCVDEDRPTRAVAYVNTSNRRQTRIRQTDDGALWYEVCGEEGMEEEVDYDDKEKGWWSEDQRSMFMKKVGTKSTVNVGEVVKKQVDMVDVRSRMEILRRKIEDCDQEDSKGDEESCQDLIEYEGRLEATGAMSKGLNDVYVYHSTEMDQRREEEEEVEQVEEEMITKVVDEQEEEEDDDVEEEEEEVNDEVKWKTKKEEKVVSPVHVEAEERDEITSGAPEDACGFRGSFTHASDPKVSVDDATSSSRTPGAVHDVANLAQTYSALLSLAILGDDMSKVKRTAILNTIRACQTDKGCFTSQGAGSECDMRFVYCAVSIAYILGDDSCIDWKRLGEFIRSAVAYDGGIGQTEGVESHGGSTFCAIASLALANHLWDESVLSMQQLHKLTRWAILKQDRGFHGRANKPDDSCYAFWIGATLEILNAHSMIDHSTLRSFLYSVQYPPLGGFCKLAEPGAHPDILHTYFSLAALSLMREPGMPQTNAALNCSKRVHEAVARRRIQFARQSHA